jgi:hypothetical protein
MLWPEVGCLCGGMVSRFHWLEMKRVEADRRSAENEAEISWIKEKEKLA